MTATTILAGFIGAAIFNVCALLVAAGWIWLTRSCPIVEDETELLR